MGPGEMVNGGVWASLNQTLIWALAQVDPAMAWDEWLKNTFARHAEAYPDIWYSTWSGPDALHSVLSKHPGETPGGGFLRWTDFPVMNLHSHACALYSLSKLLGVEFTTGGLKLAPALPLDTYRFETPLLGVIKTPAGYEGWYAPLRAGEWTIEVRRPGAAATTIRGKSAPGKPLNWSIRA